MKTAPEESVSYEPANEETTPADTYSDPVESTSEPVYSEIQDPALTTYDE